MRALLLVLTLAVVALGVETLRLQAQVSELARPVACDCPSRAELRAVRRDTKTELTSIRTRLNWDESKESSGIFFPDKYEQSQAALDHYNKTASPFLDVQ